MICETAFTMDVSGIKFGPGATRELGYDLQQLGVKRAMLVTDPNLAKSQPVAVALAALGAAGIDAVLFDHGMGSAHNFSLSRRFTFRCDDAGFGRKVDLVVLVWPLFSEPERSTER